MLGRLISTLAALVVAAAGFLLVDCSPEVFGSISGDPIDVCPAVQTYGVDEAKWVGLGFTFIGLLAIAATWIPELRPGHQRRMRAVPEHTLNRNLNRINDIGTEIEDPDEAVVADITRRVEAVEASMLGMGTPTREVTERWMRLLREANDLHNAGLIPTADFADLNTRLLDLFTAPANVGGQRPLSVG